MVELKINPEDIRATLRRSLETFRAEAGIDEVGEVFEAGDGIARVRGLPSCMAEEMLEFPHGIYGMALNLEQEEVGVIQLGDYARVEQGNPVRRTGKVLQVPVGEPLLGRVVNAIGMPMDGRGPIRATEYLPFERATANVVERQPVKQPLQTGLKCIDSMIPIGRGQRELIIGDRATGKTALAADIMINQKQSDMICVYVAVGQRATAVERVVEAVRKHGAPERCIFVVASAAAAPGLQWIAPFAGFTIAEYFRDRGEHALIVIDDLSKHAATHRELALLTREPPGREAYPGDVFYLHARLLERASRLSPELGGGSLTALPIAETDAGNLSAYIPTNLISITDGQIVLGTRLFAVNQRPAVDVGLSVSRVGGKTQKPALRDVSGRLRLDYAQFLELEMFTRFGGISDTRVKSRIVRGERIRAMLTQPRFATLRMIDQVALLAALNAGIFDDFPAEIVVTARARIAHHLDVSEPALVSAIASSGEIDESGRKRLAEAVHGLLSQISLETAEPGGD
jgi:F-type H+-transporting ATPase subunit alpha